LLSASATALAFKLFIMPPHNEPPPMAATDNRDNNLPTLRLPTAEEMRTQCPDGQIYSLIRHKCDDKDNLDRDMDALLQAIPEIEKTTN
jgi:hypothetical protein